MQDEDYMRQLSFGNDSALDTLVFRYHKPLYGYVYRLLKDEKLAEDIVQDTFMKIYQQGQKGYTPDSFKPWMYKIATNCCRDYWRKASTKREHSTDRIVEVHGKLHHIIDRQLERQWMIDSLEQLSPDYRMVLYLRFYQDLQYAEIASALEIPLGTVKTWISRGLKQLEQILLEDEQKGAGVNE
ncbi:RNA polymerase sigma factor [Sporosarcina sp. Marseille-Q4063]|uniref:RNA polymerase sigma factor n=1 Tax=Sporosarcina sp. Marseille-Q4063 TaxID=2810514 RepID=UPI001BB042A6|nr:RNA polymerase sigma factor [Sporosarcina sp. Marseille-Q4063]QUW20785.1 RNA polymerase sigma factor [Sporosarcina sp. Marseille-Q4063]